MNQSELINRVAQAAESTRATAGQVVKAMVGVIVDAVSAGEVVRLSGLGIFAPTARPTRRGRNPQTGESIEIAANTTLRFRASKTVKDALNPPSSRRRTNQRSATSRPRTDPAR